MSYLDWHVGMKVVCVDDEWPPVSVDVLSLGCCLPKAGQIYTIRQIGTRADDGLVYLRLVELHNQSIHVEGYTYGEPVFGARRFRPVQARKTSIGIFNRILLNPRIRISEDA